MSVNQIEFFPCPVPGRDKYLGAEINAQTGCVYFFPGSANHILKFKQTGERIENSILDETALSGKFKWLRTCQIAQPNHPGMAYGIPCCSNQVIKLDLLDDTVHLFGDFGPQKWKWHGAVVSSIDQAIYCIPCNHSQVLKISTQDDACHLIGPHFETKLKWYGGLEAPNGCIYAIPNCAQSVLKINPKTGSVSEFGDLGEDPFKWHGGVLGLDGNIYAVPSHTDRVLKIDTHLDQVSLIGDKILPGSYRKKGKYKYGGAVVGPNGCIYCLPSDADQVLKIDPVSEEVQCIGPAFHFHNKWQNGYLASDNCIYAIPCNMDAVLKIDCMTDTVTTLALPQMIQKGFEKWEGGVVDAQGSLWCVPQNSKHILKINPTEG